jgi:hypothetical protein
MGGSQSDSLNQRFASIGLKIILYGVAFRRVA